MPRIDAHQHFWLYDAVRDAWMTDDMQRIRQNFLPTQLQPLLEAGQLDGCIAVQSSQCEEDNHWLLSLAQQHAFIKGIVGWVDLQSAAITERLQAYAQWPLVKGFRHILQGEPNRALMLEPAFTNGIRALGEAGYVYEILIYPDQLPYATQLVQAFPDQVFVLDHIAKPAIKNKTIEPWQQQIRSLAACSNVYCKVSGMVTEANWNQWTAADFIPYLDTVTEAFGANRLLYGSDWPVCLLAGAYSQVMNLVKNYYSHFSTAEQAAIFGDNAAAVYHLK